MSYKYRDGRERSFSIFFRWILTWFTGLLTAITGVVLLYCTQHLSQLKRYVMEHYIEKASFDPSSSTLVYGVVLGINIGLVSIAAILTIFVEPVAAGSGTQTYLFFHVVPPHTPTSGISEIKSMLNGLKIPRMLRFRTLCCKVLGTVCSVAGGLPVGKEGPMIHSGGIIAAGLSQGKSKGLGYDTSFTYFAGFRNDREKRDFLSCGAAAGVAAAFGAPIGGVLFVLEEGASFWNQTLTWRTLFCAMVSTFTLAFFISGMERHWGTLGGQAGTFTLGAFTLSSYQVWEIPVFICMGVGGGLQGALFNAANLRLTRFRARWVQTKGVMLVEAIVLVVLVTSAAFWMSATWGTCHPLPPVFPPTVGFAPPVVAPHENYTYRDELLRFYCPAGQYNDLATLLLSPGESAIRHLYHAQPETFDVQNLIVFWLTTICLACLTYGLKVPSGLFIPALLMGAAYGRLWTRILNHITTSLPHAKTIDPRIYGLIGSAAMLGGITRMTISLTVILLECTGGLIAYTNKWDDVNLGNVEYGLPLIVTLFSARWVGNCFNHGIYDLHIHLRQLPFLDWDPPVEGSRMRVKHVMTRHPKCLRTVERAGLIWDYLCLTTHNGFPVVVDDPTFGSKFFAGVILRKQLTVLLAQKDFTAAKPRPFSRHPPRDDGGRATSSDDDGATCLSYRDMEATYPNYPEPETAYTLTDSEREHWVDLTPYMNQTPFVIQEEAPFTRAYRLFRSSGLRHLVVVNRHMNVKGLITRRELEEEHCARCWRLSKGDDDEYVVDTYNYSTKEEHKPRWELPTIFKRHIDRADQVKRMLHSSKQQPLLDHERTTTDDADDDDDDNVRI
ncbi:Aste57867_19033 [Aphanomyces stellatus]|uniref:Chloride channel protein n=1 Tax=Aphanomyces stellatus TaxID=120398 RepID=A0A485LBT9_9STRA|nr:hypothetical protein As57867_018969 [Aphanomyces stellatus]VFT95758.1 Aste57867_19033 [Aphanomyces stellatus]